jgi:hypothetical protein
MIISNSSTVYYEILQLDISKLPDGKQRLLQVKQLLKMTTIIYGKKVTQISFPVEAFGFMVESHEYAALQKLQFETLLKIK